MLPEPRFSGGELFPRRRGNAIGTLVGRQPWHCKPLLRALGGWHRPCLSWRWVFLINCPLAALALIISAARVPESVDPRRGLDISWARCWRTMGLGGVTFGLIEAGAQLSRSRPSGLPDLGASWRLPSTFRRIPHRSADDSPCAVSACRASPASRGGPIPSCAGRDSVRPLVVPSVDAVQARPIQGLIALLPLRHRSSPSCPAGPAVWWTGAARRTFPGRRRFADGASLSPPHAAQPRLPAYCPGFCPRADHGTGMGALRRAGDGGALNSPARRMSASPRRSQYGGAGGRLPPSPPPSSWRSSAVFDVSSPRPFRSSASAFPPAASHGPGTLTCQASPPPICRPAPDDNTLRCAGDRYARRGYRWPWGCGGAGFVSADRSVSVRGKTREINEGGMRMARYCHHGLQTAALSCIRRFVSAAWGQ